MYTYEEFKEALGKRLQEMDVCNIRMERVLQNNQAEKDVLAMDDAGAGCTPLIALKDIYELYEKEKDLEVCMEWLFMFQKNMPSVDRFTDIKEWAMCKDKIVFSLVNHAWNEKMLRNMPHMDYLDLAVVFRVDLGNGTVCQVSDRLMELWKADRQMLWEAAMANLKKEPMRILSMEELLIDLLEEYPELKLKEFDNPMDMHVMANNSRFYGARGLLRTDLLKEASDRLNADLVILPSSVHELIVIPVTKSLSCSTLKYMVTDINRREVPKKDRLSDQVYFYNRATGKVDFAGRSSC